MRRRDVIKRLTAAGVAAGAASGIGSAQRVEGVRWEFTDGHTEELTLREFDAHPETPSLSAIRDGASYSLDCCCCGGFDCVLCFRCPEECRLSTAEVESQ